MSIVSTFRLPALKITSYPKCLRLDAAGCPIFLLSYDRSRYLRKVPSVSRYSGIGTGDGAGATCPNQMANKREKKMKKIGRGVKDRERIPMH